MCFQRFDEIFPHFQFLLFFSILTRFFVKSKVWLFSTFWRDFSNSEMPQQQRFLQHRWAPQIGKITTKGKHLRFDGNFIRNLYYIQRFDGIFLSGRNDVFFIQHFVFLVRFSLKSLACLILGAFSIFRICAHNPDSDWIIDIMTTI